MSSTAHSSALPAVETFEIRTENQSRAEYHCSAARKPTRSNQERVLVGCRHAVVPLSGCCTRTEFPSILLQRTLEGYAEYPPFLKKLCPSSHKKS